MTNIFFGNLNYYAKISFLSHFLEIIVDTETTCTILPILYEAAITSNKCMRF